MTVGLELINKTSAAQYSSPAGVSTTQNVQASGSAVASSDYTAAQQNVSAVYAESQNDVGSDSMENKVTLADVKEISKVLNDNTVAEFGVYEPMNRITIKIKDKDSGEVIREIPSEKMLKVFTKACELAGILVDEKR